MRRKSRRISISPETMLQELDAPLPLIELPPETHVVKTGWPSRPVSLPVFRPKLNHTEVGIEPVLKERTSTRVQVKRTDDPTVEDESREELSLKTKVCVYDYPSALVPVEGGALNDSLVFDSVFESGNLMRAERVFETFSENTHVYEMLIHPDLNNSAYRQWFYFSIKNVKKSCRYEFKLLNLAKSSSLFGSGQQPVVYSKKEEVLLNAGAWRHKCLNVTYQKTPPPISEGENNVTLGSTLSFTYTAEFDDDTVYFACLPPYTYTDLSEYLSDLVSERSSTFRRTELCQTIAGNTCDLLTITSREESSDSLISYDERRLIIISARVHPGESNSSWMMKGIIDFLTSDTPAAVVLRRNFIFKVVPMLNPDGVINGNTRVNLAGWDLNRKWAYPVQKLFPTIYHLKKLVSTAQEKSREKIAMFCDLHGHSIHKNIFMYGCYKKGGKKKAEDPRVFPMILSKKSDLFAFSSCSFKIQKSKMNTARVVVNELGVSNSFTLEASFCGPDFGMRRDTQYSTADLEALGKSWCESLVIYYKLKKQTAVLKKMMMLRGDEKPTSASFSSSTLVEEMIDDDSSMSALSKLFDEAELDATPSIYESDGCDSDLSDAAEEVPPTGETSLWDEKDMEVTAAQETDVVAPSSDKKYGGGIMMSSSPVKNIPGMLRRLLTTTKSAQVSDSTVVTNVASETTVVTPGGGLTLEKPKKKNSLKKLERKNSSKKKKKRKGSKPKR